MAVSAETAILLCVLTASVYVSSLYVGSFLFGARAGGSRDSPEVVRRRFAGVTVACAVAPLIVHGARQAGGASLPLHTPFLWSLGLPADNVVAAVLYPLLLTAILFLGPLVMNALAPSKATNASALSGRDATDSANEHDKATQTERSFWHSVRRKAAVLCGDILVWRNLVVAPITEEFVFRACIGDILHQGGFSTKAAVLTCPVFFAVAHLHHFWDLVYYQRQPVVLAVFTLVLQMTYTTLFGWYAAFLLVRTGQLLSPIVAHMFCNAMGFPDIGGASKHRHRKVVWTAFVGGLAGFIVLLRNATLSRWLFGVV